MGLLPCLRRGSERWWLPLSTSTTEAIGQLILAVGRGDANDVGARHRLHHALCSDPPLMIFAALCFTEQSATTAEISDSLAHQLVGRFASGDAFFGAPKISDAHRVRWRKLRDHYKTLPIEQWLDDAPLWLEVAGPRVPDAWKQQWPTITVDDFPDRAPDDDTTMLQPLARMMQRQASMQESFDDHLRRSKLGALKQLAYGLSHEINNPLANISTRAQQLQRGEKDESRVAVLQRIVEQVYRAHEMIADLMFFANPPQPDCRTADLRQILSEVAEGFAEETQRQAIRLEIRSEPDPVTGNPLHATAIVDRVMISEAVRALVRNAIDAIGCEGTIVVSIVRDEQRWLIHVADSGPGLTDHARRHAFDPYFSGREAGRGLGLGLCRAYRIAKLHHGDVTLAGGPTGCVVTMAIADHSGA